MFNRFLAILGILFALFGVMVTPGFVTASSRRRLVPIQRIIPGEGDVPWDLTDWTPVGFIDKTGPWVKREWTWMPKFRRVK
jgi:hypothetical protein